MNTGSAIARFTITLSTAVSEPVQVEWFTSDGTAKAGVDYAANKGTVTFSPGETAKTVDILVYGRAVGTEDRSFFVEMLPPTNAILGASIGECIIHVDTIGSTPVTQVIVPTGPEGDSAYQVWLDQGNTGTEQDFFDSLKPDPAEFAAEVAPLIDVGATSLTAEGTETLGHPDATTVKALARRVAYSGAAKIATVNLAAGDNLLSPSDLSGDVIDFTGSGFVPRLLRSGLFSEPAWTLQSDGSMIVHGGLVGDVLYAVQYNLISDIQPLERTHYSKIKDFHAGTTLYSDRDALLWAKEHGGDGNYYIWSGGFSGAKIVPPGSSPAGGIGLGSWLSVGNASLRNNLLDGPIRSRGTGLGLRNTVTVSDFGGKTGFSNDSTEALVAFVNYINSGKGDNATFLVDGLYKTTAALPKITRPVRLTGITTAKSAILFSSIDNGISLDLSASVSGTVHSEVGRFSILTDKTLAGVAFEYLPNSGDSQSVKLEINSMRADSLDRFNGGTSNCEWLTSVKLGDDSLNSKPSEVRIDNLVAYGSDLNSNYSTLTGSGSSGIVASKATNCIVTRSKIFLLDGWGIKLNGQTEGNHVHFSQVVATRHGIGIAGTVNPSNNHHVSNTHVAPYETGIKIDLPASPYANTPIETYLNDIFILERNEATNKPGGFVGVDLAARYSKLTNVTVWANAKSPGVHTKIGFRIGCGGNILTNCHSYRMSYALDTFEVISGFAYDVALDEFFEEDSILGFITPTAFKQPAGNARAMSLPGRTWKRPVTWVNQFSLIHESGVTYFDVNGGSIALKAPTGDTTQFQHYPSAQTVAGTGLIGVGGSGVVYQGNWILRALFTMFSGSIRPEIANSGTCGVSSAPWSGGFTQTAFTVTSDETHKTKPVMLARGTQEFTVTSDAGMMESPHADAILDAWSEVDFVQFKYLDRVESKGEDAARWHFGVIAQRAIEAFEQHGLDAFAFGFVCYDEWGATEEIIDEESGEIITERVEAGSKYGIRYEEALVLEAALQRRNYERLLGRIEALEKGV